MNMQYILTMGFLEYFRTTDPMINMMITSIFTLCIGAVIKYIPDTIYKIKDFLYRLYNNKKVTVVINNSNIIKDNFAYCGSTTMNEEIIQAICEYLTINCVLDGYIENVFKSGPKPTMLLRRLNKKTLSFPKDEQIVKYKGEKLYIYIIKRMTEKEYTEKMFISGKTNQIITTFINDIYNEWCKKQFENKLYFLQNYRSNDNKLLFSHYTLYTTKTFDQIFFKDKKMVMSLLEKYNNKEINKLTLLLHGEPGTGKTSIIKAISNKYNKNIININLKCIKSDAELMNCLFSQYYPSESEERYTLPEESRMFVFEDIDALSDIVKERALINEKSPETDKENIMKLINPNYSTDNLTLSGILNALDGIIEHKYIIILTTNFPEKLDSALTRPGRITKMIYLTNIIKQDLIEMLEYYYKTKLSEIQIKNIPENPEIEPCKVELMFNEGLSIDEIITTINAK